MLYPAELCRHTIFGLKSRFFSLFGLPDRWPIFSIFSRYFFRRKCYLRPLQHLAFLIKILSTEFPSTPEYFSKVLSTGPPLGGECSIQLSYEDMSDLGLKIRLSATFQASGSVAGYSITYAFWMNYSIQLSSIHSPLVASYITLTLTDSNYRVLFPIVQRHQASPFLRRHLFYTLN